MKRRLIFFSLIIGVANSLYGQTSDSLTFIKAKWNTKKIAPHTYLKTSQFTDSSLFGANQNLSIVELKKPGKKITLQVAGHPTTLFTTSTFALENKAIAALNGTFFDIKNGGSVDYVKSKGQEINSTKLGANGARAIHQQAAVTYNAGKVEIKKWDGKLDWEQNLSDSEVMVSGPLLIHEGVLQPLDKASFTQARHPRSVVGIKKDGTLLLISVDGRQGNAAGMSLPELSKIMKWLGTTHAINLDGGGSTTLWTTDGVVNYPSDNKTWDHNGERKVANVLLLKKKD